MKRLMSIAAVLVAGAAVAQERTTIPILDAPTLTAACKQAIVEAREESKRIAALPVEQVTPELLAKWDDQSIAMENVIGPVAILASVHPDKAVRDAGQACFVELSGFTTEVFQNEELYKRVAAVKPDNATQAKFRQDLIEGFEDSGVALPSDKRARAKEISERLTVLSQEFAKNIRDNSAKLTFTLAEAKGLPESYIERVKDGKGNIVVGFDYPDYVPFMSSAENEEARKRYFIEYQKRGTAKNLGILDEMNTLRKELASLHGQPTFAHYVTRRKMVENPQTVDKFLRDVSKAVTEVEKRDLEEIRKMKAETLGTPLAKTKLNRWDLTYWRERLREKRYAIDQESMRKYFPAKATQDWLIDITQRLYGVKFEPAVVPVWHPDVQYFDVKDAQSGAFIGGVYLDLFPRDGKYKHAAAWPVRGVSTRVGRKPISVLVTNFDRNGFTFDEVETFFHEFGHVMHGVLSETEYNQHAGTNVEGDFVEAPSQIYEDWARDPRALALLKAHCGGCPEIDAATLQRLKDSRRFGAGIDYARQHLYAAFDMAVATKPESSLQAWKRLEEATPLGFVPGTEFPGTFGHLAGGYAAGYYGYMWAEVIGLDMLSAWNGNLLDPSVGMRFRKTVLARGGEKRAGEVVKEFLGRPVNSDAFFAEITGKRQ
ncbi:MAG TPA: M3 family metallopeptidase [Thermoanaerobaculia bacterium]|nr:M3 family metallopeptidase [Thermoanaerobaculia bacterium]